MIIRDNTLVFSHLQFLFYETKGEQGILTAHLVQANLQWHGFQNESEVIVLFQGPHAYMSPRWYEPHPDNVPTWNYAAVHEHGTPKILAYEVAVFAAMQHLVKASDQEWTLALSEKDRCELLREIIVFEIAVTKIDAKFKLSQNRSDIDQENVATNPMRSDRKAERETGKIMKSLS